MAIALNMPVTPCFDTLARYLKKVNQSSNYTNFGPLHHELTIRLQEYLGVENLLLVSNGTLALHIAYRTLDLKSAICTPFSFLATSSSLAWEKIPFSFVDIDPNTLNLCPKLVAERFKKAEVTDAVVATHVYGNPCDVKVFERLKEEYNFKLIYDGAHAFNVKYEQTPILNFGDASTLSFHATKVFHTIEGGAIIFKDRDLFLRAKNIINFGLNEDKTVGPLGINAKLNEYQCAVGLTLLDFIDNILDHRIEIFKLYQQSLKDHVRLPVWEATASFNGAYFPIILENDVQREQVKQALNASEIPSREYFSPSLNLVYQNEDYCPVSESISSRILCLPLHYYMSKEDVKQITEVIKRAIR